jgi:two-component system NtrC family response regulator
MRKIFHLIRKLAATDVPILITGASGTGKEMVAQAVHERSLRSKGPFVAINCGAIPRELLESQLFGYEKGAFTGAYRTTSGTLERADGGTLLLDEVGELPLELQVKLLRFLQDFSFERVGGRKTIQVDLRVISATNCDLREMIAGGRFREDLYYRLDVVNIELPPLKDRGDDALIIANVFLKRYSNKVGKDIRGFAREAVTAIQAHPWPGNIRELINRVRRSVVMSEGPWVTTEHLGLSLADLQPELVYNGGGLKKAKAKFEASLITKVLQQFQGNVQLASKALAISRSMMYNLIQKYDLKQYVTSPQMERIPPLRPNRPAGAARNGGRGRSNAAMKTSN